MRTTWVLWATAGTQLLSAALILFHSCQLSRNQIFSPFVHFAKARGYDEQRLPANIIEVKTLILSRLWTILSKETQDAGPLSSSVSRWKVNLVPYFRLSRPQEHNIPSPMVAQRSKFTVL